ncbi:DUF4145 domain-containing protein [Mesorhizobium sp. B3-1-7]|uniref:DUF4145 domain-containing protein n=1 Tax=Mesorhizobium sp. B3-1-7 TaxID=2589894 RepID=UPI00112E5908|nr:DUF4145 domain-containing protein [Mesorhizobium sp. B3-1-7]TPI65037.1 DUF4145 domain-containing protein [Mesorhizobium sp. B3-1-7]
MAELKDLWPRSFSAFPAFRCPNCGSGILQADKTKTVTKPTANSRADLEAIRPAYEAVLDIRRFVSILECNRSSCKESVVVCGETFEEPYQDQEGTWDSITMYEPNMMFPGPPLATIPPETPDPVVEALKQSFSLFWHDLGATANKLRVAAERILTNQGVKQYNRTGKRVPLTFARRIEIYSQRSAEHRDVLTALRWIGNHGSHSGAVDRDDVLTAFELMQVALQDLYGKDYRKELARKSKEIAARRGRPRRKP